MDIYSRLKVNLLVASNQLDCNLKGGWNYFIDEQKRIILLQVIKQALEAMSNTQ